MTNLQAIDNGNCLHIGCGLVAPESWKNVDASPTLVISKIPLLEKIILSLVDGLFWPENVEYGNILEGMRIKENSCDLVFASHVLEHLSYSDFHTALNNIYKYLKPGGIFRFIVPDLKKYVDNYLVQYSDINIASKASVNFMKDTCTGCSNSRSSLFLKPSILLIL